MFIVIGTCTVDLFVSNLAAMPRSEGDEFTVDSLVFHDDPLRTSLGGNGANSAYALARLGAEANLVGGLGEDHLGDWMASQLRDARVDMRCVKRYPGMGTATTLILSDREQNRLAFHHEGANRAVDGSSVDSALVRSSDMLLLTSYSIMPGLRPHGAVELFRAARRSGTRTAVDIGPAIGEPALLEELRPLLACTDYFICNEHELAVCTGGAELTTGMAAVLEGGAGCVVIKRGAEGAVVLERNGSATRSKGGPTFVPGFSVEVQTTVGAGDSFNAGFLMAVHEGATAEQAARFANAVAATVVSSPDRPLVALSREAVSRLKEQS
ncbi:MAG: carbohydrate kinase family protein [Caldilineaceae bacterium SB0661_bin_32]|uniref:Carbohydrate kinase family protein n=1 Tax=Caldilineaceae bacterium SB0661_bin_32 TaxID=2605255 RepID=A0A6B1DBP3_9CHLR|nr:carbohydrate kinase family protein [Caldilineaceae bacterium SB0661_bin_32]